MSGSERNVWSDGRRVSHFHSPFTRDESIKRADDLLGQPFQRLPGNPPQHKVIGEVAGGFKVRVAAVETVFNDWLMAEYVDGPGSYEESYRNDERVEIGRRQLEILALAKRLYQRGPN